MQPDPVVVKLDVLEYILARLLPVPVTPALDELALERLEERLGDRIVERGAWPRHRLGDPMGLQAPLEQARHVLASLVVVEDEAPVVGRELPAHCLLDDVYRHFLGDPLCHRPPHHLARERIDHDGQVEPPFAGWYVGDVAHSEPVLLAYGEGALYKVQPRVARLHGPLPPLPPGGFAALY